MTLFDLVRLSVNVAGMAVGSRGASSPKVHMAGVRTTSVLDSWGPDGFSVGLLPHLLGCVLLRLEESRVEL